jgi:hypothetical protein
MQAAQKQLQLNAQFHTVGLLWDVVIKFALFQALYKIMVEISFESEYDFLAQNYDEKIIQ